MGAEVPPSTAQPRHPGTPSQAQLVFGVSVWVPRSRPAQRSPGTPSQAQLVSLSSPAIHPSPGPPISVYRRGEVPPSTAQPRHTLPGPCQAQPAIHPSPDPPISVAPRSHPVQPSPGTPSQAQLVLLSSPASYPSQPGSADIGISVYQCGCRGPAWHSAAQAHPPRPSWSRCQAQLSIPARIR